MNRLCNKCYNEPQNCNCTNNYFFEIDKNITNLIQELNWKGYHTTNSCGGHTEKDPLNIYITFDKPYHFKNYPKDFIVKRFNRGLIIEIIIPLEKLTKQGINPTEKHEELLNNLQIWVKNLK